MPYACGLLLLPAGLTPKRSGVDAHSAANTKSRAKKRKLDGGGSGELAGNSDHSPAPIAGFNNNAIGDSPAIGSLAGGSRPDTLQNGGQFASLVQQTTMGIARDAEQERRVVGPKSVNTPPSQEQEICMRALTEVIRSRSLNARDKVKQLEVMCLRPDGSLLRRCLDGNGWSTKRNRREGYPSWPEAIHRLTLALHALANDEPVQTPEQVSAPPPSALASQHRRHRSGTNTCALPVLMLQRRHYSKRAFPFHPR